MRKQVQLDADGLKPTSTRSEPVRISSTDLTNGKQGRASVEDVQNEKIAKAEEGLAEMQKVLDHAKRAVDAADRAERAARKASEHARSFTKIAIVGAVVIVLALIGAGVRHRQ